MYFWTKTADFLPKNADISKIKETLVLKVYSLELHMCVYLRVKFKVSSIILTSFRQGLILSPPPPPTHTPRNETLKSLLRLGTVDIEM